MSASNPNPQCEWSTGLNRSPYKFLCPQGREMPETCGQFRIEPADQRTRRKLRYAGKFESGDPSRVWERREAIRGSILRANLRFMQITISEILRTDAAVEKCVGHPQIGWQRTMEGCSDRLIRGYDQARPGGFLIASVAGLQRSSRQIVEIVVAMSGNLNGHGTGAFGWNCAAGKRHL